MEVMKNRKILLFVLIATSILLATSCASTRSAVSAKPTEQPIAEGIYTVQLFGQEGPHDPETAAIVDREGDAFTIKPFGSDFRTVTVEGLTASEAAEMARVYVGRMLNVMDAEMKEIRTTDGKIAGYEFRPVFAPFVFGTTDMLLISYVEDQDGVIRAFIGLHPSFEPPFRQGGDGWLIP